MTGAELDELERAATTAACDANGAVTRICAELGEGKRAAALRKSWFDFSVNIVSSLEELKDGSEDTAALDKRGKQFVRKYQ
jgi:hypothetical protein